QHIPGDAVDAKVVAAFFAALSVVELDAYHGAVANQQQTEAATQRAQQQQLQRLRYQAAVVQRQFEHVDPANSLAAAESERRCALLIRAIAWSPRSWSDAGRLRSAISSKAKRQSRAALSPRSQ